MGNLQQPFQMVSTYHCSTQGRWWKIPSDWLQGFEQGNTEICMAHAKNERHLSKLNGAKYFSTLDLHAGYHHIPLDEDSIPETAFTSPFGKYEYLKVPFGLEQALAYFQELMNKVLKDLPFVIAYFVDINIYSKTGKEHLDHLQHVFNKLLNAELTMKLSKCHFFANEIQYLGHVLSSTCIKLLPSKTAATKFMNTPKISK